MGRNTSRVRYTGTDKENTPYVRINRASRVIDEFMCISQDRTSKQSTNIFLSFQILVFIVGLENTKKDDANKE